MTRQSFAQRNKRNVILGLNLALFGLLAYAIVRVRGRRAAEAPALTIRDRLVRAYYAATFWIKLILPLKNGRLADKRLYVDRAGEPLYLSGAQGRTLAATLYRPQGAGPHPGIVLLHGSTPIGRKLGMYRLMGHLLARRGYMVLSIDQRGYGDSDAPLRIEHPEDLDFPHDARIALRYLANLSEVDRQRVFLVGHSFGGDVAVNAIQAESPAQKLVIIGPGRRYNQRAEQELDAFRLRSTEYMGLQNPIPHDVFVQTYASFPLENHLTYFMQANHLPLLILDGGRESEDDHRFLQEMFDRMAEPKAFHTIPNADHYTNITGLGPFVIYDAQAVEDMIATIDHWLGDAAA